MPANLQSGSLDRRVTFQRATTAVSEFNEPVETWGDLATYRAKVVDASAGEAYRALEVNAQISARITVRSSTLTRGLTPKDRATYDGRIYNIVGTRNSPERKHWIEIDVVARDDRR